MRADPHARVLRGRRLRLPAARRAGIVRGEPNQAGRIWYAAQRGVTSRCPRGYPTDNRFRCSDTSGPQSAWHHIPYELR